MSLHCIVHETRLVEPTTITAMLTMHYGKLAKAKSKNQEDCLEEKA